MTIKVSLALLVMTLVSACQHTPAQPPQPAQLHSTNADACYQQIEQLIGEAIKAPVKLGPHIFEQDSRLYLDRKTWIDEKGMRKDGMLLGKPLLFELRTHNNQCLLIQQRTDWQSPLPACICQSI